MDRKEFEKEFETASTKVNNTYVEQVIKQSLKPISNNNDGTLNLVIVMEEFMEISKEISKYLRGKGDKVALTEELADAYLSIKYVQQICDISDDELNKAINVKAKRQDKRNYEDVKWQYEVSLEKSEILGSGSTYERVVTITDENAAFKLLNDGRNRLERTGKVNGKFITQIYNSDFNYWE